MVDTSGAAHGPSLLTIDLDAVTANARLLRGLAGDAGLLAVVKADGYGHGLLPSAQAVLAGGAAMLGVAQLGEALALRRAGVTAPVLAWLGVPDDHWAEAVAADVQVAAGAPWALAAVAAAARTAGRTAQLHLKVDTGLGRNGFTAEQWPDAVDHALKLQAEGLVRLVGVMSHYALADAPAHPTVTAQTAAFGEAVAEAERRGARFELRHLSNSAATLTNPAARFDLVRPGLALYGLSPSPDVPADLAAQLRPAMTFSAAVAAVKHVPAGTGVSYGLTYRTTADTRLALVPVGYADGVPRHAGDVAPVQVGTHRHRIAGRVCMDQFVVDLGRDAGPSAGPVGGPGAAGPGPAGAASVAPGDRVVLFGDPRDGVPGADEWAEAAGTISYEIVTRVGARVPRRYRGRLVDDAVVTATGATPAAGTHG